MAGLDKVKLEAWEFYRAWRASKTFCPAFQSEIRVSLKGWRHISGGTGQKKRTFADQYRRFKLLPYAKEIIEKSTTIQNVTEKGGHIYYALEAVIPVKEDGKTFQRKVRVILIEDKAKNKIFFSVMDKKSTRGK